MSPEEFNDLVSKIRVRQDKILCAKGADYTVGSADRLHNFKFIAEYVGITPEQVWAVYWLKHVLSVLAWVKNGTESEPITGRLDDISNYGLLLEGLIEDNRGVGAREVGPA